MLIVTIDTLRADRVGVYGSSVATPNIDRLAKEGAWAPQADVHVPLTRPSHVSLFTGRYPAEHGIRDNVSPSLAADVPVLAEQFKRIGVPTAAFVASAVVDRQSGLARGFDVYGDRFDAGADRKSGDRVVSEALAWLNGRQQFFAWVHLYDPHAPYRPPEPYATRYAGRAYDGTVAWSDDLVGRLVDALRGAGTLDSTLVVVTSDHGEALGDHGEDVHGYFVYEATLRVPLVFRGPRVKPGTRVDALVRTIDLFPTVAEIAGLAAPPGLSGRSVAAALNGGPLDDQPSFAESLVPRLHYGWSDLQALRDGRWKYIQAPKPELYDLQADPGELKNLAAADAGRANALRKALEDRLARDRGAAQRSASPDVVPADVRERLGALGYVGPGAASRSGTGLDDPKDRLADYKALSAAMQDALTAIHAGRHADAIAPLQGVLKRGIDSFDVHYYLAQAYAGQSRWKEAAAEYRLSTARFAGSPDAWRGLGESLVALHDAPGSVRAFERLVALSPADPVALMQLGEAYRDVARYADAARVMREAIKRDASQPQYWNSLGTVLGPAGKMDEAALAFAQAAQRDESNGMYAWNYGLALQALGRKNEAAAQFARAAALGYRPRL